MANVWGIPLIKNTVVVTNDNLDLISSTVTTSELDELTGVTALDTVNTIVKRDANGRTAVSLNDDNVIPRLSLDHNNRLLVEQDGHTTADWESGILSTYVSTHYVSYNSVEWRDFQLWSWWKHTISIHPPHFEYLPFKSLDWKECSAFDTQGITSLNWDGHSLYMSDGTSSVEYGSGQLWASDYLSLDWVNRIAYDSYGNGVIDWNNYVLSDQDGFPIIYFGNGSFLLNDGDGHLAVDYSNRFLEDGSFPCIDWGNRTLNDTSGNVLLTHTDEIQFAHNSTGSNLALLGANSPATITTAPYTWVKIKAADGTICYMPAWK